MRKIIKKERLLFNSLIQRKYIFLVLIIFFLPGITKAQDKFYTKSCKITFYSKAPLGDFEATQKSVACVLDTKAGTVQFIVLIKGFEFENEEMQEHFNSDYMESDKYPKAEFRGQLSDSSTIDYSKPGVYPVKCKGTLTIHNVSNEIQSSGTLTVGKESLIINSFFNIQVADYNMKIPSLVKDQVAKTVKIVVNAKLDPLK